MNHLLIVVTGFFVLSCSLSAQPSVLLSAADFEKKIATVKESQILDVRTPQEFASGHIKGAKNIDYRNAAFSQESKKLDLKKPVFVYCHMGSRSSGAAKILKQNGFQEIYELKGGLISWVQSGRSKVK